MKKTFMRIMLPIIAVVLLVVCAFGFAACNDDDDIDLTKFEKTVRFNFADDTSILGIPWSIIAPLALDTSECYVTFSPDGKIHGQLRTSASAIELLTGPMPNLGGEVQIPDEEAQSGSIIDMIGGMDLNGAVETYLAPMFPGFTLTDLENSLAMLKKSVGASLVGFDFTNEKISALRDYIEETGKTPAKMKDYIPEDFVLGIDFDNTFQIKKVTGADGKQYHAIYISEIASRDDTQPFAVMTLGLNNSGKRTIKMDIFFIQFSLSLVEA